MRPFATSSYATPVRHVPRVVAPGLGEEEEDWPGPGTALMAAVSQGTPQDRMGQSVEESTTTWVLWFDYQAVITAGATILRGDQLHIVQANGRPMIVLRADAHATDFDMLGVAWFVRATNVD